jgi:uncharacterized protein (DUF58 family)
MSGFAPPTRHEAEALAGRLPPLLVAATRVAATVAPGAHGRRRVGSGDSFWQFRPYEAGDSATRIDWRQTAKSERAYIRENEWEAAQSVWLWQDRSASMDWRSERRLPLKSERAGLLLLALAVLLIRGGERVALLGEGRAPALGRAVLERMAATLAGPDRAGGIPDALPLPRHATLVLIADFLAPLDTIQPAISFYAARGVHGHLLQVLDPAEETLPFEGRVRFEGLEREPPALISRVETIRDQYRARLAAQRDGLAGLARTYGWSFACHRTDHPPHGALLGLFGVMSGLPQRARAAPLQPWGAG